MEIVGNRQFRIIDRIKNFFKLSQVCKCMHMYGHIGTHTHIAAHTEANAHRHIHMHVHTHTQTHIDNISMYVHA